MGEWDGIERRKDHFSSLDVERRFSDFEAMLKDTNDGVRRIEYAFPDGPEKHRAAHEAMIEAARAEKEFWQSLKMEVAKKGVWTLLTILTGLTLVGLAARMGVSLPKGW